MICRLVPSRVFFLFVGALTLVLCSTMSAQKAEAFGRRSTCYPVCTIPVAPPPTELETGPDSDDLKVHIVGEYFDTIEVYFKTEYFYRETFPNTSYLQFGNRISLAHKNKFGTFAVLIADGSLVKAYGWKSSKEKPETLDIPVEKGCEVVMEWVTDRILKVKRGPGLSKSTIVRFNDADKAWTELYKD
jgi:hypothetical protein